MAVFAIGTELSAMQISVTISATRAHVLEDEARMALAAAYFLMHAPQRIARQIVVKLWIGADWLPTRIGMAVLTGNRKRSVRIGHLGLRSGYARRHAGGHAAA